MKILYTLLLVLAFNCQANLEVNYNNDKPVQVYTGVQPNDKATKFFNPNVGVSIANTYTGVALVIGMEYKCDGDTEFMKHRDGKYFDAKTASLEFLSGSPQRYDQWPGSPVDAHLCTLYWTSEAIGSTVNTNHSWSISISGFGVDVGYSITSTHNVPLITESKTHTDTFYMYKDDECF